ncbi:Holliday junction resolvase RuvX [Geitlerinema sp. PCC 9228]|jgi:putative Holliday junction resolvase|uniref:Holliday junction resolvase RuvX n=1 Tax=Geitlerinema sp. PCC 9228 TaxID=111611 RepID=UPI0008F9DDD3|nr:Holliday junction resolvase RuvX [Geitlerinema sp. PCC 9228]
MEKISALGLDIGRKRIGVAGCDGTGTIATGLTTIKRSALARDVAQLQQIVTEREATVLVVGLPYSMNGVLGTQAQEVQKYARKLQQILQLPVEYVDERLSSLEAEQLMHAQKQAPSRHKELVDRKAAAIILQQWLDQRRQPKLSV